MHNQEVYHNHLKSKYWQEVRQLVYRRDRGRCQDCNQWQEYNEWDCHHCHYRSFGQEKEDLESVICLCRDCHDNTHNTISLRQLEKKVANWNPYE